MQPKELYKELQSLKAYKEERVRLGVSAVNHKLLPQLIDWCKPESGVSTQACWCLEQSFLLHETACLYFLEDIASLYREPVAASGMRSLTKIASICTQKFYGKKQHPLQLIFLPNLREKVLEGCFRSLMEHRDRTANMVFAMRALFELGKEFKWVHKELKVIIIKELEDNPSRGLKNSAEKLLIKIEEYREIR